MLVSRALGPVQSVATVRQWFRLDHVHCVSHVECGYVAVHSIRLRYARCTSCKALRVHSEARRPVYMVHTQLVSVDDSAAVDR